MSRSTGLGNKEGQGVKVGFILDLKAEMEDRISRERWFHRRGAATAKALSPLFLSCERVTHAEALCLRS